MLQKLSEPINILHSGRTDCRFLQINQLKWVGGYFPDLASFAAYFIQKQVLFLHLNDRVATAYIEQKNTWNTAKNILYCLKYHWYETIFKTELSTYIKSRTWCSVMLSTHHFTVMMNYSCWGRIWGKIVFFLNYAHRETIIMLYHIHTTSHIKTI